MISCDGNARRPYKVMMHDSDDMTMVVLLMKVVVILATTTIVGVGGNTRW